MATRVEDHMSLHSHLDQIPFPIGYIVGQISFFCADYQVYLAKDIIPTKLIEHTLEHNF